MKLVLGDLFNCVGSEESRKNILHSHICEFFIHIMRENIAVCGTVGVEFWKAEAEDSSKLRVSSTLDEHFF